MIGVSEHEASFFVSVKEASRQELDGAASQARAFLPLFGAFGQTQDFAGFFVGGCIR